MYPHRINLREPWQAIVEPEGMAYRRVFSWPTQLMPFEQLWLIVGGVDSAYRVKLNRQQLGTQPDGRLPLEMNITSVVQNQNLVEILCQPDPHQPFRGITRTVFLEVRRSVHLKQLAGKVQWQGEKPGLQLQARISEPSERRLSVVVRLNEREVHYEELPMGQLEVNVTTRPFEAPQWQPGRKNVLQQLEVHLLDPSCVLAQHTFTTGFAYHAEGMLGVALPEGEVVFESCWLEEADRQGRVVTVAGADVTAYWQWLWFHPCVVCSPRAPS